MRKYLTLLFVLLLASVATAAETQNISFNIVDNKVAVDQTISATQQQLLLLKLPADASSISLYLDGSLVDYKNYIQGDAILVNANTARVTYLTKEFFSKNTFLVDIPFEDNTEKAVITLVSDVNQGLSKPIDYQTLTSNAVFPKPTSITTDGQRIYITWEKDNLSKGDTFSIFVTFAQPSNILLMLTIALIIIIAGMAIFIYFRKPKVKTKVRVIKEVKQAKPNIEKYLKEDEEQIVNILKQREGHCEQGTLTIVTGFSKAKLSSLLKELEERNIVYKEQKGKKNVIHLKE